MASSNSTTVTSGGRNDLGTTFAGVIQDGGAFGGTGGALTKIGNGRLILSGANTYTGGTTIARGKLLVKNKSGSGTGKGPVAVNAGMFGGTGIIAGAVTLGTGTGIGAALAPGKNDVAVGTVTILSTLTFNSDGVYLYHLDSAKVIGDTVIAGGVTINNAQFSLADLAHNLLPLGTVFTVIDNRAATPIAGNFLNLADGSIFAVGDNTFQVSYEGGDGNDLTLTVVP